MQLVKKQEMQVQIPEGMEDVFNITDNMEGVVPRLPQIKIAHTAQMFKMPDEQKVETFEGVILDQHPANAWWEPSEEEIGDKVRVPNCFSQDGISPMEGSDMPQADKCNGCPQNEYGTAEKGEGKACKNMKRFMVLQEGSLFPRRLTIPPSSLKSADLYMTSLVDRGLPYRCVVTEFKLLEHSKGEVEYSEIMFEKVNVLEADDLVTVAGIVRQYKDAARGQDIQEDEYLEKDDSDNDDVPGTQEEPEQKSSFRDKIPF